MSESKEMWLQEFLHANIGKWEFVAVSANLDALKSRVTRAVEWLPENGGFIAQSGVHQYRIRPLIEDGDLWKVPKG